MAALSPFLPLKNPVYRMMWGIWVSANVCMWMNDVAAAWLMTTLTTSPLYIALVQSASTLPMFLLGLPSGALADIFDRRKYFICMQWWVAAVGIVSTTAVVTGHMTPWLLLALTFANGIGLAMRLPVFAAIVPDLVPRQQLSLALALNGIATNGSRIIGPLIGGLIISSLGSAYVFALNAVLSVGCSLLIMRWKYACEPSPLGREKLTTAIRVGLQFVLQSRRLKSILIRVSVFSFHTMALLSLLPLAAKGLGGGAGNFTVLLAAMGAGAIAAAILLPRIRQLVAGDAIVLGGASLQALATVGLAFAPNLATASLSMFFAGMAWITTVNSLSVSSQLSLPDWVRARGMSMFQMSIMGASAAGAAVWGHVAAFETMQISLSIAAVTGVVSVLVVARMVAAPGVEEDLTPDHDIVPPVVDSPSALHHVVIAIEYRIDPQRAEKFHYLMQESRTRRLRQGALRWELLHDVAEPGRYVEQVVEASWTEYLRRFDRITASDMAHRARKLEFHLSKTAPLIKRYLVVKS